MVDININLKVPAVEKLVDYVASGVGAIAGPLLAPLRASWEGKARIITAEMDARVRQIQAAEEGSTLQLIAKAQDEAREYVPTSDELESDGSLRVRPDRVRKAVEFQAEKRLMNVRAIAGHAAKELGDTEVTNHDPDPDWIARFFDGAQDVSSEELQKLWGQILAGEVKSPGQTSLRTLSILRDMTQQDAKNFSNLMRFRIFNIIFHDAPGLERILGESSNWLVHFSQIGLLGSFGEAKRITLGDNGQWKREHCGHDLIIEGRPGHTFEMRTIYHPSLASLITVAGMELAKLCQHHEPHPQYLPCVAELLAEQGCTLKYDERVIKPSVEPEERDQQEPNNAE